MTTQRKLILILPGWANAMQNETNNALSGEQHPRQMNIVYWGICPGTAIANHVVNPDQYLNPSRFIIHVLTTSHPVFISLFQANTPVNKACTRMKTPNSTSF